MAYAPTLVMIAKSAATGAGAFADLLNAHLAERGDGIVDRSDAVEVGADRDHLDLALEMVQRPGPAVTLVEDEPHGGGQRRRAVGPFELQAAEQGGGIGVARHVGEEAADLHGIEVFEFLAELALNKAPA